MEARSEKKSASRTLQVTAYTFNVRHKSFDTWSWAPRLAFRVNGPIASDSLLDAEFAIPGGPPVKFDCKTGETKKGAHWNVPVQIIGDQDGQWDKSAWKTEAFYGNPLTGFNAVP